MLTVQPWAWNGGDEELRTVGVWTGVGHGQQTWSVVVLLEVFIWEFSSVDRFSTYEDSKKNEEKINKKRNPLEEMYFFRENLKDFNETIFLLDDNNILPVPL